MPRLRPRYLQESDGAFEGVGGVRLQFRAWEPPAPRAAVIIVHGHGEHSGRYAATASRLGSFGYSSYAFDLRGHGRSEGRRGHVKRFEQFLQDVERFRREVAALIGPRTPLFLLGQSMGGLIGLRFLQEVQPRLHGAIMVAPWLETSLPVPRWTSLLAPVLARLLPALPLHTRLDPALLSRDPRVVEAYREDPLVHDVLTPRAFREVSAAMNATLQRADRIQAALLFLLPGEDRVVDSRRSESFARALAAPDVSIELLPGFYHEPLNEVDRAVPLEAIRRWMDARL